MDYYYFPPSHWSRILSLVLAEKTLEPEPHFVDIRKNATMDPDYMRINPRGVVPTFVDDDGQVVWDGPRIATHLDAKAGPRVMDPDPEATDWAKRLEDFPLMHLSYRVWVEGRKGERSADILQDKIDRTKAYAERHADLRDHYERKHQYFVEFQRNLKDATYCKKTEADCRATLDELGQRVSDRSYVGGDQWSFADAIATSILFRLTDLEVVDEWSREPEGPLARYFQRLQSRPSYRRVWVDDPLIARATT